MMNDNFGICTGTGRCGTKFISLLFGEEQNVDAFHDPNPFNLAFHRYAKWNNLPIDDFGFLHLIEQKLQISASKGNFCFISSAHLAFSLKELSDHFRCKFLILIRHPRDVVNSYLTKGYFETNYIRKDVNKALGYQDLDEIHHFLGRTVPNGNDYYHWENLTRVGKIAWTWNAINKQIIRQLNDFPEENYVIQKLEELDFQNYTNIAEFFGIKPELTKLRFRTIARTKPNRQNRVYTDPLLWNERELNEYRDEVKEMAIYFNYEL